MVFLCRLDEALIRWGFLLYKDIAPTAVPKNSEALLRTRNPPFSIPQIPPSSPETQFQSPGIAAIDDRQFVRGQAVAQLGGGPAGGGVLRVNYDYQLGLNQLQERFGEGLVLCGQAGDDDVRPQIRMACHQRILAAAAEGGKQQDGMAVDFTPRNQSVIVGVVEPGSGVRMEHGPAGGVAARLQFLPVRGLFDVVNDRAVGRRAVLRRIDEKLAHRKIR